MTPDSQDQLPLEPTTSVAADPPAPGEQSSLENRPMAADAPSPETWFFLTNRQNLLEVLSARLIAPAETYTKYYDDLLAHAPGRVVLVGGAVSEELVGLVVDRDDEGSFPVMLEFTPAARPDAARFEILEPEQAGSASIMAVAGVIAPSGIVVHFQSRREMGTRRPRRHA